MNTAIIHFSDNSTIELHENDFIVPIVKNPSTEETSVSMYKSMELWSHTHNGLIPSILDALYTGFFFYVNNDFNTVYNVSSIVRIEIV